MHSTLLVAVAAALLVTLSGCAAQPKPTAKPDLGIFVLNNNAAWCWYQDPRVIMDKTNGTLLVGSVAAAEGPDGKDRVGDIDLTACTIDTGKCRQAVLHHNLIPPDDHDCPALLIRPDGRYLAAYSRHNQDSITYYRISVRPHDSSEWGPEQTFDWQETLAAVDATDHVTYNNLYYLPSEGKLYDFCRAVNHDPSILVSTDQGDTFTYAGKLLTIGKLGYVNGYTKYASNGVDRIDFITTDHHPRDYNNNIYHGYLMNGRLHRSDGTVVDKDVFNSPGHPQTQYTKIFAANSEFDGETMTHAWTMQVCLDSSNLPCALISCRANDQPENTNFADHRFFYCRYDGKQWNVRQLAKAGPCLWPAEQDYTGLATLNPNNFNEVYISTTIDPRYNRDLHVHEIFKGATDDNGVNWTWTPITEDSKVDNLRPLATAIDDHRIALVWFRGKMTRSQHYNSEMVCKVEEEGK
jgi:hypothetical protein